jgi:GTP-binding protein
MTKAKPKVADYPFTTINPSLGVVEIGFGESYVVADIPGLIEGAADGIGLGTQFLKHLSRTNILLHVVDIQHIQENQINIDLIEINHELEKFDKNLINKKQYIIFNKIDLLSKNDLDCIKEKVYKIYEKEDVFFTSTVNNIGINELKNYISRKLKDL